MGFGGAHVWKTSHPQVMEFFHTQKTWTHGGGCGVPPPPHYTCQNFFIVQALCTKKVCASSSAHTLGSPFTCLPAAAVDKLPQISAMTLPTNFNIHMHVT